MTSRARPSDVFISGISSARLLALMNDSRNLLWRVRGGRSTECDRVMTNLYARRDSIETSLDTTDRAHIREPDALRRVGGCRGFVTASYGNEESVTGFICASSGSR